MAPTIEIKAVHIADLAGILDRHGQLEDFEEGRIACAVCAETITRDNAGSIRFVDGKLVFACHDFSCHDELVRIAAR